MTLGCCCCAGGGHPQEGGAYYRNCSGPPAAQPLAGEPAGVLPGLSGRLCSVFNGSAFAPGLAIGPMACFGRSWGATPFPALTCQCGAQENVNRLKAYKASLVVFPRRSKKPKTGDTASKEEREGVPQVTGRLQPLVHAAAAAELETAKITEEMQVRPCVRRFRTLGALERVLGVCSLTALWCVSDALAMLLQAFRAYYKLRLERTNKKHLGKRAKRAAEAAAEEKDKAK